MVQWYRSCWKQWCCIQRADAINKIGFGLVIYTLRLDQRLNYFLIILC
jgi:hypothetical protein